MNCLTRKVVWANWQFLGIVREQSTQGESKTNAENFRTS